MYSITFALEVEVIQYILVDLSMSNANTTATIRLKAGGQAQLLMQIKLDTL